MKRFNLIHQEINDVKVELIEFYDEHIYKIGDRCLPSISKKLGVIDKGWGFHQWERQTGLQAAQISKDAADSGNKIHNAIERALMGNEIKADDPEFDFTLAEWKKFLAWSAWWDHYEFEPLYIEQIVYDLELGTAGKLDCIAKRGDKVYVLDWKTGNDLYDSYDQQIQFYKNSALKLGLIQDGAIPALVHIGSKHKKFSDKLDLNGPGIGVRIVDQDIATKKLIADIQAWDLHNPDWQAPTLVYPRSAKVKNYLRKGEG